MVKLLLSAFEFLTGFKDLIARAIQRREDISVGVEKKTIADDKESLNEIKTAIDAGRAVTAGDGVLNDPADLDK